MSNSISNDQLNPTVFEILDELQLSEFFQKHRSKEKVDLRFTCRKCEETFQRKNFCNVLKQEFKVRKEKYFLCKKCSRKASFENLTEEEKLKRRANRKKYFENLSEDEKEKRSETLKMAFSNLTETQKAERSRKISEKRKSYFQRISEEELKKTYEKRKQTMQNKSPEEKASIQEKWKKTFSKKSKKELEEINLKRSKTMLNKTIEEKKEKVEGYLKWWNSLTEEERKNRSKRISEKIKKRISERTDAQKLEIRKKASSHLGKYKTEDGEVFDSSWELKFFEFHKNKGDEIKREPRVLHFEFEGVTHSFIPDFEVNGQLIEIKGNQFFDKNGKMINPFDHSQDDLFEAKHQCGLQNGVLFLNRKDLKNMGIL